MAGNTTINVIAFPFAGGDRFSYRAFQPFLGAHIKWWTLELPGRGMQRKAPLAETFNKMEECLYEQAMPILADGHFAIFGHSMGAMLGYQFMNDLHEKNLAEPVFAFFSGAGAPGYKPRIPISHLESQLFWTRIAAHNGVPQEILSNNELKDYFEPALRNDFAALEVFCNSFNGHYRMSCPLYLRWGSDETISEPDIAAWQKYSYSPIDYRAYPGDHFAYIKEPSIICGELNDLCFKYI